MRSPGARYRITYGARILGPLVLILFGTGVAAAISMTIHGTAPRVIKTTTNQDGKPATVHILLDASEAMPAKTKLSTIVDQLRTTDGTDALSAEAFRATVSRLSARVAQLDITVVGSNAQPGSYEGSVLITDGTETLGNAPVTVFIRQDAPILALILLLLGSILGASLKWATDVGLVLSSGWRAYDRIMSRTGSRRDDLPVAFFDHMSQINLLLRQGDSAAATTALAAVSGKLDDLVAAAEEMNRIKHGLGMANNLSGRLDPAAPTWPRALASLSIEIDDSTANLWPEPKGNQPKRTELRQAVNTLVENMPAYNERNVKPFMAEVLRLYAAGHLAEGTTKAAEIPAPPLASLEGTLTRSPAGPGPTVQPSSAFTDQLSIWVVRNLPILMAIAVAIFVALWGFDQEYMKKDAFGRTSWDFVQLFLWAVAVQVAGMTAASALTKLVPATANR